MNISEASFAGSSARVSEKPKRKLPEIAFIGRSNVGKSSLVNMLCGKRLAHISATPGKTRLVNHFLINDSWYLVDLPGYGYARTGKKEREALAAMIEDYTHNSEELMILFVLMDSRHDLQKIDLEFLDGLGCDGIPCGIIFTKGDKSGPNALREQVESNKMAILEHWEELPPTFVTSAKTAYGRDEILGFVEKILENK